MSRRRKWGYVAVAALLAAGLAGTAAGAVVVDSETIVRTFERDTSTEENVRALPVYEYLGLSVKPDALPGFSAHAYGWGRYASSDLFEDNAAGEILYGYLRYRSQEGLFQADAGRMQVAGGVALDTLDGLSLRLEPLPGLTVLAYGGLPVALSETSGISGDLLAGGRVAFRYAPWGNLGVSYRRLENDGETASTLAGADVALTPFSALDLQGYYSYNLEADSLAEATGRATLHAGFLDLSPFYRVYEYEGFFDKGVETASPFRLLGDAPERLTVYGADAGLYPIPEFTLEVKARHYDYKEADEGADYYGALLEGRMVKALLTGVEGARMDGDTPENRYDLGRVYFRFDAGATFVSGEGIYVKYDEPILGEDNSLFASLGFGVSPGVKGLVVKLSGDYSKDPYFDRDVRGMLTLHYRFEN